ncbi:hypothetical protein VTL71DRAFT_11227 [Oculimacula yallundae]|uniref:Uncharacterized protein n=1 Tax=Oculimacula yallundae TaxID=86028 RepID=A0ABR4CVD3_9HELO
MHLRSSAPKIPEGRIAPDLGSQRVYFEIIGDDKMNWRLRNMYEYGSFPTWSDPTAMNSKGRDDKEKHVEINGTEYLVTVDERNQDSLDMYWHLTLEMTSVIVLTYDVSSKASYENMKKTHSMIPPPKDGKLRLSPGQPSPDPYYSLFVLAKWHPVVIIGCRYPEDNPREVEKEDVEAFVRQHPDCIFAGECMPKEGVNENVDEVFRFVVEVYHELRKQARREEDLYVEPPTLEDDYRPLKRKKRSCILETDLDSGYRTRAALFLWSAQSREIRTHATLATWYLFTSIRRVEWLNPVFTPGGSAVWPHLHSNLGRSHGSCSSRRICILRLMFWLSFCRVGRECLRLDVGKEAQSGFLSALIS